MRQFSGNQLLATPAEAEVNSVHFLAFTDGCLPFWNGDSENVIANNFASLDVFLPVRLGGQAACLSLAFQLGFYSKRKNGQLEYHRRGEAFNNYQHTGFPRHQPNGRT